MFPPRTGPAHAVYFGTYEMVKEMARQTNADVVVLDAVQLAAGECGHFGKGTLYVVSIIPE